MYTRFFGLEEAPFAITPDPRYLYLGHHHREALAHLLYGVGQGGGFVLLTGEVGTGKTTLCRSLTEQVPPEVDLALVLNPKLTVVELLAGVCDELRVPYPMGTASVKVLVDALYGHVLASHAAGRRTVLIIDEAQNLSADVLEQIRLLTNLETSREKLLQIVLIGQPELARLLEGPRLRQLAQRITARYHLPPLSAPETAAYVRHRIEVAGRRDPMRRHEPIFSDAAIGLVHRLSRGIPRLINVICDRALLGAYAHDREQVDAATIRQAASEVLGPRRRSRLLRASVWVPAVVLAAVAAVAVVVLWTPAPAGRLIGSPAPRPARAPTASPAPPAASPASVVGRPAATVIPPAPFPDLAALIEDPALAADRDAAVTRLATSWGVELSPAGPGGCEGVRQAGLDCLPRTGTWTKLRRFNLPAVLELTAASGERRYAVVTRLGEEEATLALGGRSITVPRAVVDPYWDGAFVLVWRAPTLSTRILAPGMRGKDVEWLRRRLGELDGAAPARGVRDVYDDDVRERVVLFQRSRSLVPDGIAGEETLAHLALGPAERPLRLVE
jgi:general secretion pathway protein A